MTSKLRNKRKARVAERDIDQYCQSVENLLLTINDSHRVKKTKKRVEIAEDSIPPDDDSWPLSDN